ncbi:MAG: hypothetical protein M3248_01480, partial [Actinomycetota bacterium]|nr:hypothetical protein [Actinomycetota bacterium]
MALPSPVPPPVTMATRRSKVSFGSIIFLSSFAYYSAFVRSARPCRPSGSPYPLATIARER